MNRRESLRALGLMAAGTGLFASACNSKDTKDTASLSENSGERLPGIQDFEYERTSSLYKETFFTEHELATITVLADIIIPKDAQSPAASEAGVPAFIEFIVKDLPDYKTPMRGGLKWLDIQCNKQFKKPFKDCPNEQQIKLVEAIAYPDEVAPGMEQGAAFFTLMRDLTASGYYTSEVGIKDLAYAGNRPGNWTGVPADILKEHGFDPINFMG